MQQVTIYREDRRFAGWPANYGIWHWGDEILVGYTVGYFDPTAGFHASDSSRPFINVQSRSLDRGMTWQQEAFLGNQPAGYGFSADEHMIPDLQLGQLPDLDTYLKQNNEPIDFHHPQFALMCSRTGLEKGTRAFFHYSYDKGKHWNGIFALPNFGQTGIMARTDYIVLDQHSLLMFLTANKANGHEGKVICVRTDDGGVTWQMISEVGDEPAGEYDYMIMPASLKLPDGKILCSVRCHQGEDNWIDVYQSDDNAHTWRHIARPVEFGYHSNPPTLHRLSDGRLVMTYGNRIAPFTIEAKLSSDNGQTWGDPIILRSNAGDHDIGYPRTVVLADDTLVTAYYINDEPTDERYIEASILSV